MAILSNMFNLLFEGNRKYGVGSIQFDLILSENHSFDNTVSDHKIEDGSIISDHIQNELMNGSLSGLISNFSLKIFGAFTNRAQDAFDAFEALWKEKTLVTIVTVLKVYENVAITNVSVERSSDTGEALVVGVSFRQVNIVKLKSALIDVSVNLKNMKTNINRQASTKLEVGRSVGQ